MKKRKVYPKVITDLEIVKTTSLSVKCGYSDEDKVISALKAQGCVGEPIILYNTEGGIISNSNFMGSLTVCMNLPTKVIKI